MYVLSQKFPNIALLVHMGTIYYNTTFYWYLNIELQSLVMQDIMDTADEQFNSINSTT